MFRKGLSLLLALVWLGTCATAAATAANTPSKTTGDLTRIVEVATQAQGALDGFFWLDDAQAQATQTMLETLAAFLAAGNSAVDFFGAPVREQLAALLAQVDLAQLTVSELLPLDHAAYDPTMGDVTLTLAFPTPLDPLRPVAAVLGYLDAQGVQQWLALQATVDAQGNLALLFPAAVLLTLPTQFFIAVLVPPQDT